MRKHWFFDFDGTLCDTEADIIAAWKAAIKAIGRECQHFDKVYKTGPTIEQVTYMLFDDATPELVNRIRAEFKLVYDDSGFPHTKPYPWIPELLGKLKSQGCKIYVATNKRYNPTCILMKKLGWDEYFDGYYSFDMYEGEKLKKADLLKRIMQEKGIEPEDGVMVGDTLGDIEAGRGAGLHTIGCTWGYGSREEVSGADEIYDKRL